MILDILFPNRCLNCNQIIDGNEVVCDGCFQNINFTHYPSETQNVLYKRCKSLLPLEEAYALMVFEEYGLSRKILHELKYRGREIIGKILADWTKDRLTFNNAKPDLITTIPLHPKKQKERGYNQLHSYANEISKHYQIPLNHQLLRRNYYAKPQALKDKQHRSETQNLFSITQPINNQHVLIIDDVFTTGNTIASGAWEILNSGDNKVSILVMAVD